jgi:hypothetical protein
MNMCGEMDCNKPVGEIKLPAQYGEFRSTKNII